MPGRAVTGSPLHPSAPVLAVAHGKSTQAWPDVLEVVRTLGTTDHREAQRRRDTALAAIRAEIDAALVGARLPQLTDWTAEWPKRAMEWQRDRQEGGQIVVEHEAGPHGASLPWTVWDHAIEHAEADAGTVAARQGRAAGDAFTRIVMGDGITVAEGARLWLAEVKDQVVGQTWRGHQAALKLLEGYLGTHQGIPTLQGLQFSSLSRRTAGEFLAHRLQSVSGASVQREFSTFSGLWRWAVTRGHTEINPWADQTAGSRKPKRGGEATPVKRGYTPAEQVKLLRGSGTYLAPQGGGYGPAMWDMIRLGLLTGARANELASLRIGDVIEGGTAVATSQRGKTENAARIIPLQSFAQRVIRDRLATLPDQDPGASLWPEIPKGAGDEHRSKTISTRYVSIRRRFLGPSDELDFHSFRRSFVTAAETAMHHNGRLSRELLALLTGHARGTMALDLYSDWTRLGRRRMDGAMASKLTTLREAMEDIVTLGMDSEVLKALEDTAGDRPPVVRVAPAFSRPMRRTATQAAAALALTLALGACVGPAVVVMKNPTTGEVVQCKG
eukprot:gene5767-5830_t